MSYCFTYFEYIHHIFLFIASLVDQFINHLSVEACCATIPFRGNCYIEQPQCKSAEGVPGWISTCSNAMLVKCRLEHMSIRIQAYFVIVMWFQLFVCKLIYNPYCPQTWPSQLVFKCAHIMHLAIGIMLSMHQVGSVYSRNVWDQDFIFGERHSVNGLNLLF